LSFSNLTNIVHQLDTLFVILLLEFCDTFSLLDVLALNVCPQLRAEFVKLLTLPRKLCPDNRWRFNNTLALRLDLWTALEDLRDNLLVSDHS